MATKAQVINALEDTERLIGFIEDLPENRLCVSNTCGCILHRYLVDELGLHPDHLTITQDGLSYTFGNDDLSVDFPVYHLMYRAQKAWMDEGLPGTSPSGYPELYLDPDTAIFILRQEEAK